MSSEETPENPEETPVSSENPPVKPVEKMAPKGLWKTEAGELKVCGHCLDSEGNLS